MMFSLIQSCSKDESINKKLIETKWKLESINGQTLQEYYEQNDEITIIFSFNKDGSCVVTDTDSDGTYTKTGEWHWVSDSNKIRIISSSGNVDTYVVEKLTAKELWIYDEQWEEIYKLTAL